MAVLISERFFQIDLDSFKAKVSSFHLPKRSFQWSLTPLISLFLIEE